MNPFDKLPPHIKALYKEGCRHRDNLLMLLNTWPVGEYSKVIAFKDIDSGFREKINDSLIDILGWINTLWLELFQGSVINQDHVMSIWARLEKKIADAEYIDVIQSDIKGEIEKALSLILSVSTPIISRPPASQIQQNIYTPNTAFILMWMDPSRDELDDTRDAIKEVCASFGIKAVRSDDVETSDQITSVILRHIVESEFIIADLTGERPNVYYEVGYAHALNKRIILYRKKGTNLHFDLAGYNIPEYKNMNDLKDRLRKRLEDILGRETSES